MSTKVADENSKNRKVENVAKTDILSQLMGLYLLVVAAVSISWVLGHFQIAFYWTLFLTAGLFVIWKTKFTRIIKNKIIAVECNVHRKRALRQSESSEWLNFVLNRWWVFCSNSIQDIIKKRVDERLKSIKPSFISQLVLKTFTFGETTPTTKHIKAFELLDGAPYGRRPVAWNNVWKPPDGLDQCSSYKVVLELDIQSYLDDFLMVLTAKVGSGRAGLSFDIAVEELGITGNLQIICHMSMDVPFPHVQKITLSFTEEPQVWFNVKVLKTLQIMEVPLLKTWIQANISDGICKALVDPGKIDIPIVSSAGPVKQQRSNEGPNIPNQFKPAQGVLTITLKGSPFKNKDSDAVLYTMLRLGDSKRQTPDHLCIDEWTDICTFFVYNLAKDKLVVKNKCRRLLTNVTLDHHDIELSSFPLELKPSITTFVENENGSKVDIEMKYTPLTPVCLDPSFIPDTLETEEVAGVMYVCIHSATKVMASDLGGTSDPYCVLFCDRRRVMTTPYVLKNVSPVWESSVEFFVQDYTKAPLSFYVYDWDGSNIVHDDFLGSTHFVFKEEQTTVIKENLMLGHNDASKGFVQSLDNGYITISVAFRPVSSVRKSERYRVTSVGDGASDYLYHEDLVSPSSVAAPRKGGGPDHEIVLNTAEMMGGMVEDKTFIDLTIVQAKDLMGADRNGLSDPYCDVLVGGQKVFKSSVKKNTLFPKWNESTSFQVKEDNHLIEIFVYDKDVISKDFLGKVILTLEKMKEISHKGISEWIPLQRTKSGQIQIKCNVTCTSTLEPVRRKKSQRREGGNKANIPSDVFLPLVDSVQVATRIGVTYTSDQNKNSVDEPLPPDSPNTPDDKPADASVEQKTPENSTKTSTLPRSGSNGTSQKLQRSTSDVSAIRPQEKQEKATKSYSHMPSDTNLKHSGSKNSVSALHPGNDSISIGSSIGDSERIYSVSGKVLQIRGLKLPSGNIYVKIRIETSGSRVKFISHTRVIAKSYLFPVSTTSINQPFEIDKGAGVSLNANLIFDIKHENKDHLAQKSISLKELFNDYKEGGVKKWLGLSNGIQIQLLLSQGKPDPQLVIKKSPNFLKTWSFRKEKTN